MLVCWCRDCRRMPGWLRQSSAVQVACGRTDCSLPALQAEAVCVRVAGMRTLCRPPHLPPHFSAASVQLSVHPATPLQPGFDYTGGPWKLFPGEPGKTYNLFQDGSGVRAFRVGAGCIPPCHGLAGCKRCFRLHVLPPAVAAGCGRLLQHAHLSMLLHERLSLQLAKPNLPLAAPSPRVQEKLDSLFGAGGPRASATFIRAIYFSRGPAVRSACIAFYVLARSLA